MEDSRLERPGEERGYRLIYVSANGKADSGALCPKMSLQSIPSTALRAVPRLPQSPNRHDTIHMPAGVQHLSNLFNRRVTVLPAYTHSRHIKTVALRGHRTWQQPAHLSDRRAFRKHNRNVIDVTHKLQHVQSNSGSRTTSAGGSRLNVSVLFTGRFSASCTFDQGVVAARQPLAVSKTGGCCALPCTKRDRFAIEPSHPP